MELEKHAKHKPGTVRCDDCHMTATTAGGTRYSVHDHKFDFSQPEISCRECHDAGDERLGRTPTHVWNIQPVPYPEPLPVDRTCARCHGEKGEGWVADKLKALRRRF